jgi:hypothetical protein
MTTAITVVDPREKVKVGEFNAIKNRCYKARDFVLAANHAAAFYIGERKNLIKNKGKCVGYDRGVPMDVPYFDALIAKCRENAKLYQAEYDCFYTQMQQLKPFILAKDWLRDWK